MVTPQLHGDTAPLANISPLNQASTIAAMRGLSREVKESELLAPRVAELLWPELLTVPINPPPAGGLLRTTAGRVLHRFGGR